MKIIESGQIDFDKQTVFLDVDDVLLKSSWKVIDIINEEKGTSYSRNNLKDWCFKSIDRSITPKKVESIFDSDKFFSSVEFSELVEEFEKDENNPNGLFNSYNWILLTKGNDINLQKKYELIFNHPFFARHKDKIGYYGLNLHENKNSVHMISAIQIDDNYNNLKDTDADLKILLKNEIDTNYNSVYKIKDNLENLYVVDNIQQMIDILRFTKELKDKGIDILEDMVTEIED